MPKTVIAEYRGMDQAQKGMDALEAAGIEASSFSLEGPAADRAGARGDTSRRDAQVVGGVTRRAVVAGLIGMVAGAVIGWLVGQLFFGTAGMVASVVAGAVAIGGLAAFAGGMARLDMSEDWELTHGSNGRARLRLGARTDEELQTGLEALRSTNPDRLEPSNI